MLKTLRATFGRYTLKYGRSYYWEPTDSSLLDVAETMRGELNKNGYDLDLSAGIIRVTRRRSVFGYMNNGYLSIDIFKERSGVEEHIKGASETWLKYIEIVELPVR